MSAQTRLDGGHRVGGEEEASGEGPGSDQLDPRQDSSGGRPAQPTSSVGGGVRHRRPPGDQEEDTDAPDAEQDHRGDDRPAVVAAGERARREDQLVGEARRTGSGRRCRREGRTHPAARPARRTAAVHQDRAGGATSRMRRRASAARRTAPAGRGHVSSPPACTARKAIPATAGSAATNAPREGPLSVPLMPTARSTGNGTRAVHAAMVTRRACRSAAIHAWRRRRRPEGAHRPQRPAEAGDEETDQHEPEPGGPSEPPCINKLVH